MFIVPGLILFARMEQRRAHGTSLAAALPIAAAGLLTYVAYKNVDWWATICLVAGTLPGTLIGTRLLSSINRRVLSWSFVIVALTSALRLLFGFGASEPTTHSFSLTGILVLVGFVTGVLSGLLGIGGGIVMVPALMMLGGVSAVIAKGTSLAVIVPTSVIGTWRNRRLANVDLRAGLTTGIAGSGTAVVGGIVAEMLPERVAVATYALLMVVVCSRLVLAQRTWH